MPRRHAAMGLAIMLFTLVGGCDSLGRDLNDFALTIMPPSPVEAVEWASATDPDMRRRGTLLLANAYFGGEPEYMTLYRDYAANEVDPLVRAVAIRALAKHGSPEDAELIAPHLEDPNLQVRWEAAKGLQRLHNPVVAGPLVTALRDQSESQEVRVAAATALGQYAQDLVFQALVAALDDRSLAINIAAHESLQTLTGATIGMDRQAWIEWYEDVDSPFADGRDFFFPTYYRPSTWFERIVFWAKRVQEQPGPPAGFELRSERRTYDDSAPDE